MLTSCTAIKNQWHLDSGRNTVAVTLVWWRVLLKEFVAKLNSPSFEQKYLVVVIPE
ncbi:hypothetical protein TNIN_158491, partial [Trichonephila inaurata madagascariensis]